MKPAKKFELPKAPAGQNGPVKAWSQSVVIPTYLPLPPDKNPMFLENRVYQGSSGRVYPLPFIDRIATEATEYSWQASHLENEFLRVMVLPEIGGRIHVGMDKTNGYDFFYRQNVIKPALVGLAGPWISGGVEFNWPQHHRPATFMPVNVHIESHPDGSRTIWCSDHDPMNRLKGMHGVCLYPGKSYIELKVRLYNRTSFTQTFLWWANAATHVHERYQSFFPPDVHHVADHAKRAVSRFPLSTGHYYGVNYGRRDTYGIAEAERSNKLVPPGDYAPNDLTWYANIPVPTSYMAMGSHDDFCGGYDHQRKAGLVHVANRHISPGKKQWTWGNHEFGYAWDRNLTDDDGPYIELMAGVYTDNQPDFSFLAAGETRTFSQYWYPIREIGPAHKANLDAAVSLTSEGMARVGVCVTQAHSGLRVALEFNSERIAHWERDLAPGTALLESVTLPPEAKETDLTVKVRTAAGREILSYTPSVTAEREPLQPATEPALPENTPSNDELYLTGVHLEQYRHATRHPEDYWLEALRRDPGDSRCNNAMGLWYLRRGELQDAERHFRRAIQTLTKRNPNPYDGEPYYNLGLTLRYAGRDDDAYSAFYKATWNSAWRSAGFHALAELDTKRGDWNTAIEHLIFSLRANADNLNVRNLLVYAYRRVDRHADADRILTETLVLDSLDIWARRLSGQSLFSDNQARLDLAFDYARAGLYEDASNVLYSVDRSALDGSVPIALYALANFQALLGHTSEAGALYSEASHAPPDYCFPNRLEELFILQSAVASYPQDARAAYYLGNLLYDRRRHRAAIELWERSSRLWPEFSIVWRNLGIAYFNILGDAPLARAAFEKALQANPQDARLRYEHDQLAKRIGDSPDDRLAELEKCPDAVGARDDLCVELASLYNQTRQHHKALSLIRERKFQPWEGGEGLALGQHVRTHLALGRRALVERDPAKARSIFETALRCPENFSEATHPLANQSDIYYLLGVAFDAEGNRAAAESCWQRAASYRGDFQEMSVKSFSDMTYYSALALKRLNRTPDAEALLHSLRAYADTLLQHPAKVDYFATSLPAMLLFNDDLQKRNTVAATFLLAQAALGLGETANARQLLAEVLRLDRNHPRAADLLAELDLDFTAVQTSVQL